MTRLIVIELKKLNYLTWLTTAAVMLGSLSCAESDPPSYKPSKNAQDMGDMSDQRADLNLPLDMGKDMADMAPQDMPDQEVDLGPMLDEATLCVLQDRDPWSDSCDEQATLSFGIVYSGQPQTRRLRVNNTGTTPLTITRAELQDQEFTVNLVTYDRAQPATATIESAPLQIEAKQAAFIEVSWTPGSMERTLESLNLALELSFMTQAAQTYQIAITGTLSGCPPLTLSCDGTLDNGCETPINTLANCGGCNIACALDFATESCTQGQCVIDSCESGNKSCDNQDATGCETNILTSKTHCGDCNQACDFDNATESCIAGQCTFGECAQGWANCDMNTQSNGCEINTASDPQNCGACFNDCARPGATVTCQNSACQFTGCQTGFYNLDGDNSNGCEYACNFQSATDLPDPMGIDANCDGIDGDIATTLFVAIDGDDANPGNPAAPLRTIAKAVNVAKNTSGLDNVYVSAGRYREQIYLDAGVSIYGGYQRAQGWVRDVNFKSELYWDVPQSGRIVALQAINIIAPTTIDQMYITTSDAFSDGISTYAMHCQNCSNLTISNSVLSAGRAGAGVNGISGQSGTSRFGTSGKGGDGTQGSDNGSTTGKGGNGGTSACGRPGGKGGEGGSEGKNAGKSGLVGTVNVAGGAGGSGGDPGRTGSVGTSGPSGSPGTHGSGGGPGTIVLGFYIAQDGTNGAEGTHGNGGGGGGGGGGQGCFICNNGTGNGGGGGGGGGCAGSAGTAGKAGGSSFGLFLYQSTGITLNSNVISASDGGKGGDGGLGGDGSLGGGRGLGNNHASGDIGPGGNGGLGGKGGDGGDGGGGAGGLSYAVYRSSTTAGLPGTNTLNFGTAGLGGGPSLRAGTNGQAGQHN